MIERPRFLSGEVMKNDNSLQSYTRRPRTLQEPVLRVNNFLSPAPVPRHIPDFDGLRALDEQQQGIKVQLSDKTLNQLFSTQIPDSTDIS